MSTNNSTTTNLRLFPDTDAPTGFQSLKGAITKDGRINFDALQILQNDLKANLTIVQKQDLRALTKAEELAFFINSFHFVLLYQLLKKMKSRWKRKGFQHMWSRFMFFKRKKHIIGGQKWSLFQLQRYLLDEFKDPRIHCCLSWGCLSSPRIPRGLYAGANLEDQLEYKTLEFICSPYGVILPKNEKEVLLLSRIFDWYVDDFEEVGIWDFCQKYYPQQLPRRPIVRFLDWHWTLASEHRDMISE